MMASEIPMEWMRKYPELSCPAHLFGLPADNPAWKAWKIERDGRLKVIEELEAASYRQQQQQQQQVEPQERVSRLTEDDFLREVLHPLGSDFSRKEVTDFMSADVPFGMPLIPTSIDEVPIQSLHSLYGKRFSGTMTITKAENFFGWNNGIKGPKSGFTCVFVCPYTYELFPPTRYISLATTKSGKKIEMWKDDDPSFPLVWYSRKGEAEQGAAAARYDCWYYRKWLEKNPDAPKYKVIGLDDPYVKDLDQQERLKARIPAEIREKIEVQMQKFREKAELRALTVEQEAMQLDEDETMQREENAYRNAYLEHREALAEEESSSSSSDMENDVEEY